VSFPVVEGVRFEPFRLNELFDYNRYVVVKFFEDCRTAKDVADKVIRAIQYPLYMGQPDDKHVWNHFHGKWCRKIELDYWQTCSETALFGWGDCLFPDTPIVVSEGVGYEPDLVEVADLVPQTVGVGERYYPRGLYILCGYHKDYKSSAHVFYPVNWVMKKVSTKPKVRIKTGKSVFDVTSDHLILCKGGEHGERTFKTPLEAREAELPLSKTSLPLRVFRNYRAADEGLEYELGWLYGLFAAEGSCGRGWWKIRNTDERLLERAKEIMEYCCKNRVRKSDFYRSLSFEIIEEGEEGERTNLGVRTKPLKCLVARAKKEGKGSTKARGSLLKFSQTWRGMFYTSEGRKRIPRKVLNGSVELARGFIDGFNAGDARTTTSKILAFGLVMLYNKLGVDARIAEHSKNLEIVTASSSTIKKRASGKSVKLMDNGGEPRIVYDLNVPEPHIFVAGDLFVHNCEDSSVLTASGMRLKGVPPENVYVSFGVVKDAQTQEILGGHAYVFCRDPSFNSDKYVLVETTLDTPPPRYPEVGSTLEDLKKSFAWEGIVYVPEQLFNDSIYVEIKPLITMRERRMRERKEKYEAIMRAWKIRTKYHVALERSILHRMKRALRLAR